MSNKKTPVLVIVIVLFLITAISLIIESQSYYDIHNIDYKEISSIRVYDRGLLGNNEIEIRNGDSLKLLSQLIKASISVDHSQLNMKNNQGLCELHINFQKGKNQNIIVTKLTSGDGIVSSGQFFYYNKKLLDVMLEIITSKQHKA